MMRILHVTPDDKFFDRIYELWNSEPSLVNDAIIITRSGDSSLKWIKNRNVHIVTNEMTIEKYFRESSYDVLYFHSLPLRWWNYVNYIPNNKIVIWWAWGFDIYNRDKFYSLIPIRLFMPQTKLFEDNRISALKKFHISLYQFLCKKKYLKLLSDVLNRIDYLQTVTRVEYSLMKKNTRIEAKQFFFKELPCNMFERRLKLSAGSILLGNSATSTNNHIDVLYQINKYRQINQKIIMPLSYGGDKDYLLWLYEKIKSFENVEILSNFLPPKEYDVLMNSCSYLCIGSLRQQAMGNIYYALRNGIKLFLYRESVIYQELSELGYVVFTINDLDENSFKTPLTEDQMRINNQIYNYDAQNRSDVFYKCIREIKDTLTKYPSV